jgi:hypothetical protein
MHGDLLHTQSIDLAVNKPGPIWSGGPWFMACIIGGVVAHGVSYKMKKSGIFRVRVKTT